MPGRIKIILFKSLKIDTGVARTGGPAASPCLIDALEDSLDS